MRVFQTIDPFHATALFLYLQITSENLVVFITLKPEWLRAPGFYPGTNSSGFTSDSEVAIGGSVLWKRVFLKILRHSHSHFTEHLFYRTPLGDSLCRFSKNFKNWPKTLNRIVIKSLYTKGNIRKGNIITFDFHGK